MIPYKIQLEDKSANERVSIRIDKKILDKLRRHAKKEGTSLNSTISSVLGFGVTWTIPASKACWVPLPKVSLKAIMERLDDTEIEDIATNQAKNAIRDLIYAMTGKYTVKNLLEIISMRSKAAGFNYQEIEEGEEIHFVMHHDMGIKWSLYFKILYEIVLYDLGCKAKFGLTENTVTYTVHKKDYR